MWSTENRQTDISKTIYPLFFKGGHNYMCACLKRNFEVRSKKITSMKLPKMSTLKYVYTYCRKRKMQHNIKATKKKEKNPTEKLYVACLKRNFEVIEVKKLPPGNFQKSQPLKYSNMYFKQLKQ
jgi:hypothetical protein